MRAMKNTPLMLTSYPRAILHIDADAFFASVEQALEPSLKGKPIVTGKERGIIACANYMAKDLGIKRGIPLFKAKKICPELVILPNDYETYGLFSKRMFDIMRKYTPMVEEYSVDEAFLDITGTRRLFRASYEEIGMRIQKEIQDELGITVSVGLSSSKSLAKICSKFRKPEGFTAVPGRYIHILLQRTSLDKVWGFGANTVNLLNKYRLKTAYDFVMRSELWAKKLLHSPGRDIWNELRGKSVMKVETEESAPKFTIMKSKTFTPPSTDKNFVFARLMRNVESAFIKARRHKIRARMIGIVLRHQDFHHSGLEARLNRPTSSSIEATFLIRKLYDQIFTEGGEYRSTMVVLGKLDSDMIDQYDLFEDRLRIQDIRKVTGAIDTINRRYGKHTVSSGTSLYLSQKEWNPRDDIPARRKGIVIHGETKRQRIGIPRWGIKV